MRLRGMDKRERQGEQKGRGLGLIGGQPKPYWTAADDIEDYFEKKYEYHKGWLSESERLRGLGVSHRDMPIEVTEAFLWIIKHERTLVLFGLRKRCHFEGWISTSTPEK